MVVAWRGCRDFHHGLLVYEQAGKFKVNNAAFEEAKVSNGTFAIVLADFNKDNRLDVAMAQSENAFNKELLLATDEVPVDTIAPFLTNIEPLGVVNFPGTEEIRLRSHDNKSPLMLHDFKSTGGANEGFPSMETWAMEPADPEQTPGDISKPGMWYGEYLWRVQFNVLDADVMWYRLCAIDAADNKHCTELMQTEVGHDMSTENGAESTTDATTALGTGTDSAISATDSEADTGAGTATGTGTNLGSTSIGPESDTQSTSTTIPATESAATSGVSDAEADSTPTETFTSAGTDSTASEGLGSTGLGTSSFEDGDGCGCRGERGGSYLWLGLLGLLRRRAGRRPRG